LGVFAASAAPGGDAVCVFGAIGPQPALS
jgi:hypothetical protein